MSDEITAVIIEPQKPTVEAVPTAKPVPIQAVVVQPVKSGVGVIQPSTAAKSQAVVVPPVVQKVVGVPIGPQTGPPAGGAAMVVEEVPTGPVDGVNSHYTTAFAFTSLWVYVNGLRMKTGFDFNVVSPVSFSMVQVLLPGDILLVDYLKQ